MKKWVWRASSVILIVILLFSVIGSPIVQNKVSTLSAGFVRDILTIGLSNVAYASATPDYICDGADDNVQVQAALDDLPATGGKLIIYGGNYSFSATVSRATNNITFEGSGKSTYLTYDASTPLISAGSQTGWVFRDIRTDAGWLTLASDTVVVDCWNVGTLTYVGGDSHSNKTLLDTYTQTEANLADAVSIKHSHANQSILNAITESFTTALKTSYDWLVTNITSAWKTTVDNFIASKGAASGLAPLDANSKVPTVNLGGAGADNTKYLRGDQTWVTPTGGSGLGYTLNVQALTSSPTDAQTVYFGQLPKVPQTTANISKVYIHKAGTITIANIYCYSGTAGTNQAWSLYVRLNNTTDYLITTLSVATNERVFSNTGLSIAVAIGDYIEIKGIQPTWTTNPLTTIYGGYVYIE